MAEVEILKMLNLILGASVILLCLLIFVIGSVLIHYAVKYYGEYKKIELDTFGEEIYKSLSNK